jgi:hypothetical protein
MTEAQIAAVQAVYDAHDPAAPLPLPVRAQALVGSPLAVSSATTPALNGAYATDDGAQAHIAAEIQCVQLAGTFADGTATVAWPDASGAAHVFTVPQFQHFAMAVAAYVAALFKVINGTSATLPPSTATIP